ncbi:SRPBCC domain-containing protein [Streptomyces sp. CC208A]|uniref:SRPBCC domain-containing protein n=1 Tax=Streptomyces sp. CC208A TaxID=3044573 RepID=UPI0024A90BFD|nr:SRPBCC domain-containing protein [Streptomyces sp. CC208A]
MTEIPRGRSETHDGDTHLLRYAIELPHPQPVVWAAVASPEGLPSWFGAADPLEPRLGGRVVLRRLDSGTELSGRVTAWDMDRVAEYTVGPPHERIRFHLEPAAGGGSTVLRFTHEFRGDRELMLDRLADWHERFEGLRDALDGRPTDWRDWTPDRRAELRELYARDEAPWPRWVP